MSISKTFKYRWCCRSWSDWKVTMIWCWTEKKELLWFGWKLSRSTLSSEQLGALLDGWWNAIFFSMPSAGCVYCLALEMNGRKFVFIRMDCKARGKVYVSRLASTVIYKSRKKNCEISRRLRAVFTRVADPAHTAGWGMWLSHDLNCLRCTQAKCGSEENCSAIAKG